MWDLRMYEWMALERITGYQQEAAREARARLLQSAAAKPRTAGAGLPAPRSTPRRPRRALVAGLAAAALGVFRRT
jgi:hypothetical protein